MSDNIIFTKYRANELLAEFHTADKKKNASKRKQTMGKVIANITLGNHDMINLFPEIIKIFTDGDISLKRMCYHYFCMYGLVKPDLTLSILPIVLNDIKSSNTQLLVLTIRNITSIPIKGFLIESIPHIRRLLEDRDPFIRKTAVFAIGKMYEKDPKLTIDNGFVSKLKYMLGDSNTSVVSAAAVVLSETLERSKGTVLQLTKPQVLTLADLLSKADEWQLVPLINIIMEYTPQTHEESFILIDKSISFLQHTNTAVVLNTTKLILYLLNYVDAIPDYLTKKLASSMTSLLTGTPEIQFLSLRNVILLILSKPNLIPFDVTLLFCEYNDPLYVKDTKLEIIYLLANPKNLDNVLHELKEYATDIDVQMSRKAIRAIGNLAVKMDAAAKPCVDALIELATSGVGHIVQETVVVFKNILRRYDRFTYVIPTLVKDLDKIEEPDAKASIIWIIGHFSQECPQSESILADLTYDFVEDPLDVQLASLTATVKLFLRKPEKTQKLVLKILKQSTEEVGNPDVRSRGFFYWRLLSIQDRFPGTAKEIIDGDIPKISNENDQLDPIILEELELNISSLASVYLKPVGEVFRTARRKSLKESPAKSTESSRVSTAGSLLDDSRNRAASSASSTDFSGTERHIDDYDVPAENVKPLKKQNGLSRHMSLSKVPITRNSLSRKLSIKSFKK